MTQPQWPDRIRLHGGRNTHAARPAPGLPDGITACGYPVSPGDDHKDDNAPVTCRACLKEMNQ